jgi:hypothetical protein
MHKGRERRVVILAQALSGLGRTEWEILKAAVDVLEKLPSEPREG